MAWSLSSSQAPSALEPVERPERYRAAVQEESWLRRKRKNRQWKRPPSPTRRRRPRPEADELTDEQLDNVSGGQATFTSVSTWAKDRHDQAKNAINRIR